ncbi:hypothetical protein ACTL32_01320 [Planococcus sp. FY231025]
MIKEAFYWKWGVGDGTENQRADGWVEYKSQGWDDDGGPIFPESSVFSKNPLGLHSDPF